MHLAKEGAHDTRAARRAPAGAPVVVGGGIYRDNARPMPLTIPTSLLRPWQEQLSDLVTDPAELLSLLGLDAADLDLAPQALQDFPLRVPRPYLARMRRGDPRDPLLLQVLPLGAELLEVPGYSTDPLQEAEANAAPGLLHKYEGRVLVIATQSCAIHCRYCFRRHFPYADNRPGRAQWQQALDYIATDASIREVILSGGDPLATSNTYLEWLVGALGRIPHLQRLRLHTRLPIMLPDRVDRGLLDLLGSWRGQVVMVLHANHAQEFDAEVDAACAQLRGAGVQLLNQSVLLKGINDSTDVLCELSERLFAAGVLPYYLHQLDKVAGAAHFAVPDAAARQLVASVRNRLPGYLVPQLVREAAGDSAKAPLPPA
jgi:EF-P beta-lysylation protein EpmB